MAREAAKEGGGRGEERGSYFGAFLEEQKVVFVGVVESKPPPG